MDVNRKRGTPLRFCINCSDTLIAATSSKYVSGQSIRNSWSCDACGFEFETAASIDVRTTRPSSAPVRAEEKVERPCQGHY